MFHSLGFLQIEPPQGSSTDQGLSIITGPVSPMFSPPQGIGGSIPAPPQQTKTFTMDIIVQKILPKTFTMDAVVQLQPQTKIFTIDIILQLQPQTKTFTMDAVVQQQLTKTFTIDTRIINQFPKTFTIDTVVIFAMLFNVTNETMTFNNTAEIMEYN